MVTTVKTKHLPGTLELTVGIHSAIGHCAQREREREGGGRERERKKRGGVGYDCISGLALVFTPLHLSTVG